MTERETITFERRKVTRAFIALGISAAVAIAVIGGAVREIRHGNQDNRNTIIALHHIVERQAAVAVTANRTAKQLAKSTKAGRALRAKQLAQLHSFAVKSCTSRHTLVIVLSSLLERSIADSQAHPIPGASVSQQAAIDAANSAGLRDTRRAITILKKRADCKGVKPLVSKPTVPPIATTTTTAHK